MHYRRGMSGVLKAQKLLLYAIPMQAEGGCRTRVYAQLKKGKLGGAVRSLEGLKHVKLLTPAAAP